MALQRMDHVGIVVDDLPAAIEFFTAIGLERRGGGSAEGEWVDRIIGLEEVATEMAMMHAPDGTRNLELFTFRSPAYEGDARPEPANAPGIRHLAFAVDDIDEVLTRLRRLGGELVGEVVHTEYGFILCYVRGPSGVIVELAQPTG